MTTTFDLEASWLADANSILDAFENFTVGQLVQLYRNWVTAIESLIGYGGLGSMDSITSTLERHPEIRTRAVALSVKLDRAADLVAAYTLASYPERNMAVAAAARLLFETMTDGPELRSALLTDAELLGDDTSEVAA